MPAATPLGTPIGAGLGAISGGPIGSGPDRTEAPADGKPAVGGAGVRPATNHGQDGRATPNHGQDGRATGAKPKEEPDPCDQWLLECYAGRHRQKWTGQMTAPLTKMLAAADPAERLSAALALVPLGKVDVALPALLATVRANPELLETAEDVLPWLVWQERRKTFQQFRELARGEDAAARLIYALGKSPDRRAADMLWELLADPKMTVQGATVAADGLRVAYLGSEYYSSSRVSSADRRELAKAAAPRTAAGGQWQAPGRIGALGGGRAARRRGGGSKNGGRSEARRLAADRCLPGAVGHATGRRGPPGGHCRVGSPECRRARGSP